jgi:hypothetical protein
MEILLAADQPLMLAGCLDGEFEHTRLELSAEKVR